MEHRPDPVLRAAGGRLIPVSIAERWRPMWHPDVHPERPWGRDVPWMDTREER